MSTLHPADRSAILVRADALRRSALAATFGLATGLLAGCAAPAPPLAGADPSNPAAPTAGVAYRSTVSGYRSQRPVAPGPWIEQNERVAPNPDSKR